MTFDILPSGTRLTGFVSAEENEPPRQCDHCVWYKHDLCHNPLVMIDCEIPGEDGKPKPVLDDDCCNLFQSPGKTLIYGLRHGTTKLNEEGKHRGWMEVPLDDKGVDDAHEAAEQLADAGIRKIYCSDLERAMDTADIVGTKLGVEPCPDFRLRPWNKGSFQGESKVETKDDFQYYIDNPDEPVPGGESLNDFTTRYYEALEQYLAEAEEEGVILLVFHTSNAIATANYVKETDRKEADREVVAPGGILKVARKKEKLIFEPLFKTEGDSLSGS